MPITQGIDKVTICVECGEIDLYYVPSCGDGAVGDSAVLLFAGDDARELRGEVDLIAKSFKDIEQARADEDPQSVITAQDSLAKLLEGYVPQTSGALPSKHLVQAYHITGKKWTYVRSDRMRNHWRSYSVDKSLLTAQQNQTASQLDKGRLRQAWSDVSKKVADDLAAGITVGGSLAKGTVSGSITDLWDSNWLSWVDAVNDSLGYSNSEHPNFDLSAAAQIFRGYAGFNINLGYDPSTNTYGLSASGNARAVLAEAKADLRGYLPDRDGWHALIEFADEEASQSPSSTNAAQELDFGYFRFYADISVDAMVGASIMGTAGIEYSPESDGTVKGKGTSAGGKGEIAAGAFAGVEASAGVKGGLEWDSPEERRSSGAEGWSTVFDVGVKLGANAGIGAEAHFKIELSENGRLYVRAGAQLVIGVGAKGGITAAVGLKTIGEFVVYIYHQLVANDFSLLKFISGEAFEAIKNVAYYLITEAAQDLAEGAEDVLESAKTAVIKSVTAPAEAEKFARRIQARPDLLVFAPPETKGMILYRLSETFYFSREEYQEGAILVVMDTIQSKREWEQVVERVTLAGTKSTKLAGMARLNGVLDFGSQTKFTQKVLEIESQRTIAPDTPTRYYA